MGDRYSLDPLFIVRGWPFTDLRVTKVAAKSEDGQPSPKKAGTEDGQASAKKVGYALEVFDDDKQAEILDDALQQVVSAFLASRLT